MQSSSTRGSGAWIVVAHVAAAAALGLLEALKLGGGVGRAVVPVYAATGLVIGAAVATAERFAPRRWWAAALTVSAPSLIVSAPVASTLFDGAYAQTLPAAGAMPYLLPIAAWIALAGAVAAGRRLPDDKLTRGSIVMGLALALGGVVWVEKHVLGGGYPGAHVGATIAVLALAGTAVRVAWPGRVSTIVAAVVAALAIGTALAAAFFGLRAPADRRALAMRGDQGRDLVRLWRQIFDLDRDGSSALLGGGDCDDLDATVHPGARDVPGDGIDQDCDGADAVPLDAAPARTAATDAAIATDLASFRALPNARAVLDRTREMSILLVTVDALRLDLLADGAPFRAEDFPRITQLLDESVWFTRAIAPGSSTDTSLSTIVTGRADPYQRVATTLPEAMRQTGHRTYSAIPDEVTRYVGDTILARGVDKPVPVYTDWEQQDVGDHISAAVTSQEGLRALDDAAGKPSFIWLHFFDVHEHHQIKVPPSALGLVHDTHEGNAHLVYRALLHQIDGEVGRVLDALAKRDLLEHTIVVFASDHGESLGDDPRLGETHGRVAYAPLVRIPLAIRIPGVPGARRTDTASLVDLAPTLLDLVGAPDGIEPLDGVDLVPALLDGPAALRPSPRAIAIHEEWQWAVVEWPYELLVKAGDNLVELYDLEQDPLEKRDLSAAHPDVIARLRARFAEAPDVKIDRSPAGRQWREQQAQPPPKPAPP